MDLEAKFRTMTPPSRQMAATSSEDDVEEASYSDNVGLAFSLVLIWMDDSPAGTVESIVVTVVVDIVSMAWGLGLRKRSPSPEQ